MCGIVGIFSNGAPVDRDAVATAVRAIRHRGPDDSGIHVEADGHVALGATRLAIIDLTAAGHQPMHGADGRVTLVFNGEIYNFRELRRDLAARGHRFRGHSDTEVLLAGYLEYGQAVLNRLNGIFAFAIYDQRTGELLLARDPSGVKPLYYAATEDGLVFGSEIKALLSLLRAEREPDLAAIGRYLTFLWCPGDRTALKGVLKLPPGTALIARRGAAVRQWTYYAPPRYAPRRNWTARDCARELHDLLQASVERQMVSDAPMGAFLSGGVDSSAVVAAARKSAGEIRCFTIDLKDGQDAGFADDLPFARQAAQSLGVTLDTVEISAADMADGVADMVALLDEPLADPACLNLYFMCRRARDLGIKVLLSGLGGDDLFSGYRRHTFAKFDAVWSCAPGVLLSWAERIDRRGPWGRRLAKGIEAASFSPDERIARIFAATAPERALSLLAPDIRQGLAGSNPMSPLTEFLAPLSDLPPLEKCLSLDRRFFLADHNLLYTDKMSMAASVEVRVPMLDDALVAFAQQIPHEWKHRGWTRKWILKQAEAAELPRDILHRPKTGFGAPLRRWIGGDLAELADDLLSRSVTARRGLFDHKAIADLRAADAAGAVDGSYTLFAIMCVELWCRTFIDSPAPTAARPRWAAA